MMGETLYLVNHEKKVIYRLGKIMTTGPDEGLCLSIGGNQEISIPWQDAVSNCLLQNIDEGPLEILTGGPEHIDKLWPEGREYNIDYEVVHVKDHVITADELAEKHGFKRP